MKLKTPLFILEIEKIFLVVLLISFFSINFRTYIASYFICYLFILFHEMSHILIAAIIGKDVEKLTLSTCGVNVLFKKKCNNTKSSMLKSIILYLIGPISNIILACIFIDHTMIFSINIFLALVNLLPLYPLDGYNIIKIIMDKKFSINTRNMFLNIIEILFLIILFFTAILQILITFNPSLLMFITYIYISKKEREESLKYEEILSKIIC